MLISEQQVDISLSAVDEARFGVVRRKCRALARRIGGDIELLPGK